MTEHRIYDMLGAVYRPETIPGDGNANAISIALSALHFYALMNIYTKSKKNSLRQPLAKENKSHAEAFSLVTAVGFQGRRDDSERKGSEQ